VATAGEYLNADVLTRPAFNEFSRSGLLFKGQGPLVSSHLLSSCSCLHAVCGAARREDKTGCCIYFVCRLPSSSLLEDIFLVALWFSDLKGDFSSSLSFCFYLRHYAG